MVARLRTNCSSSLLWRVIYLTCTVAVFLFILFDVLDLDGSNFPSERHSTPNAVVASTDLDEIATFHLPGLAGPWSDILIISLAQSFDSALLRSAKEFRFSLLNSARHHGYRLALPRSSTADPSLPA